MISNKAVRAMALAIVTVASVHGLAGEPTAAQLYGQGVHAYFAENHDTAIALLSEAIEQNPRDPRAYFFRGLARASRDGVDAGVADFAKGAELEVDPVGERRYDVDAALQRVQGRLRLVIEHHRKSAHRAAVERKKKQARIRYENLKRREDVVLFRPDRPSQQSPPEIPQEELPDVDLGDQDPFASDAAFIGGEVVESGAPKPVEPLSEPEEQPTEESGETLTGPFGEETDGSEGPAGKTAAAPSGSAPGETPSGKSNPFEEENPFGGDVSETPSEDPLFDENVAPKLPADMNVGGNVMDILEKTLSGAASQSSNRDPFSDEDSSGTPTEKPEAGAAAPSKPAPEKPAAKKPEPATPDPAKQPKIDDNPFD